MYAGRFSLLQQYCFDRTAVMQDQKSGASVGWSDASLVANTKAWLTIKFSSKNVTSLTQRGFPDC